MRLGFLHHPLDFLLVEAARRGDGDLLLLAGAEILRLHVDDAVGVDVEGHLDLRHTARSRRDASELEAAEQLVVRGDLTLTLIDLDLHRRLVVVGSGEGLRPLRRDRGVALDQLGHHATLGLDAEGQRRDVEQQDVLDVPGQHAGLDRGADGDDLIRVDAPVRLLAEQLLDDRLHLGDARRPADEHHLVDLRRIEPGVGERLLGRPDGLLQQVLDQLFELRAAQFHLQVLGPGLIGGDERQVDVGLHHRGELHLRLLRRFLQALERHPVLAEIDAFRLFELGDDPVDDSLIEVVAAKVRVAVGRLDLDDAFADFENRDIERAAAEIVDGDRFVLFLVEAVRKRRRRRLVDDAHHLQSRDLASVLGRLPLRVVEVCRNGDHRLRHRLPEVLFRGLLQLLQNHRGDLGRRVFLAGGVDARVAVARAHHLIRHHLHFFRDLVVLPAHEALDREDGVLRVRHRLSLGHLADQPFARLGERHHRRRQTAALRVRDDHRFSAFHHGDDGVCGAQVDSDNFAHRVTFRRSVVS